MLGLGFAYERLPAQVHLLEDSNIKGDLQLQQGFKNRFETRFSDLQLELWEAQRCGTPYQFQGTPTEVKKQKARLEDYVSFFEDLHQAMSTNGPRSSPFPSFPSLSSKRTTLSSDWVQNQFGHCVNTLLCTPLVQVDMLCENPDGWTSFLEVAEWSIDSQKEESLGNQKKLYAEAAVNLVKLKQCTRLGGGEKGKQCWLKESIVVD